VTRRALRFTRSSVAASATRERTRCPVADTRLRAACERARGQIGWTRPLAENSAGPPQGKIVRPQVLVRDGKVETGYTRACPEGITRAAVLELCAANGPHAVRDMT
jgi:hypothetical protein